MSEVRVILRLMFKVDKNIIRFFGRILCGAARAAILIYRQTAYAVSQLVGNFNYNLYCDNVETFGSSRKCVWKRKKIYAHIVNYVCTVYSLIKIL